MRLRFWLGFCVVAAIAIGSIALALIVHKRESDSFERTQRGEAGRAAHQAEALARLSVGQLASAAAFYQAEGHFSRHEFNVVADSLLKAGALTATGFVGSVPRAAAGAIRTQPRLPDPRTRLARRAAPGRAAGRILPADLCRIGLGPQRPGAAWL